MTVCAHRTDNPGFFTPCALACGQPCPCAAEVQADLEPPDQPPPTHQET